MSKDEICNKYLEKYRICKDDKSVCNINGYGRNICNRYENSRYK